MKKRILVLFSLMIIACMMITTIVTSASNATIPDGLIMAYDFEGEGSAKGDPPLIDKATAGTAKDDISTIVGENYTIENGIITIGTQTKFQIANSADLQNITAYTVYFKVKVSGDYNNDWISLFTANQIFRAYINASEDTSYAVMARDGWLTGSGYEYPAGVSFKKDTWMYMAYTLEISQNGTTAISYISTDGINYDTASKSLDITGALNQTSITEFGWNKQADNMKISYDDIFVFNRALSANEVKTLSTIDLPTPVITTAATTTAAATTATTKAATTKAATTKAATTAEATTAAVTTVEESKGCGSVIGIGTATLAIVTLGTTLCVKKRRSK